MFVKPAEKQRFLSFVQQINTVFQRYWSFEGRVSYKEIVEKPQNKSRSHASGRARRFRSLPPLGFFFGGAFAIVFWHQLYWFDATAVEKRLIAKSADDLRARRPRAGVDECYPL